MSPYRRAVQYRLFAGFVALWFAFGCYAFVMLGARNAAFIAPFPAGTMQAVDALPLWVTLFWGLGLGAGLLGSLLAFKRARWASLVLLLALAGLAVSLAARARAGALPEGAAIPAISIMLAALLLWLLRRKSA